MAGKMAVGTMVAAAVFAVGQPVLLVGMKVVAVAAALRVTVEAATVTEEETAVQVPRQTQGEAVAGS